MTYEIVRVIDREDAPHNVKIESHLVKLDTPTVCRGSRTTDLYEVDHVIVEALQIVDDGVVYQETHVVASDESANIHEAILYQATRALTVPEAMFSIGEHNYDPAIETAEGYEQKEWEND